MVFPSLRLPDEAFLWKPGPAPSPSAWLSCRLWLLDLCFGEEVWRGFHFLLAVVVLPGLPLACQSKNWEGCGRRGWSLNLALSPSAEVQQNDKPDSG